MGEWSEDIITVEGAGTLDGLFRERVRRSPDAPAYRSYDAVSGAWRDSSWREVAEQVARWQAALLAEGLPPGARVAVLLRNSLEWVLFDQAALAAALVVVPLYTEDRPDNVRHILQDSAASLVLLQDMGHWRRVQAAFADLPALKRIVVLGAPGPVREASDPRLRAAQDWLPGQAGPQPVRANDPDGLASIVYTSGTTGRAKGVMLSHRNMLFVAHGSLAVLDCYQQDLFLSFLPLSHTLERTCGYYVPMMAGAATAFARSISHLAEDLRTVRPTVIIAVPRIFERVYARLNDRLARRPPPARLLFRLATRVGWRRFEFRQGRRSWHPALALWPPLRRAVAAPVLNALGGRLRIAVCGGAALPPAVGRVFLGLGLTVIQGYGLTETSPVVTANPIDDNDPASIGVPLRGIEVRIGAGDELLVKGPGVMLGYWNNHTATAQTIDADGWLHTGDCARIEGRHVYITGRIKDILVLSNGEKVSPGDMEQAVTLDPLFDQALVVGEGRPYLGALLVLNPERWYGFAGELGADPYDPASLENERVHHRVVQRLRAALHDFPGYAKVRRVSLSLEPWTVDNGLLTPTLKPRRAAVARSFEARIRGLYEDESLAPTRTAG
ncbi:MAG TPA: long-chain fatty acid--CoA ligase [Gammaproteobacteria bacterium]|nr:long-chain fatty acid--CoA ligase [Gammaproteobacteria bacterium]